MGSLWAPYLGCNHMVINGRLCYEFEAWGQVVSWFLLLYFCAVLKNKYFRHWYDSYSNCIANIIM